MHPLDAGRSLPDGFPNLPEIPRPSAGISAATGLVFPPLFRRLGGDDRYILPGAFLLEQHVAGRSGEERVVGAHPDIAPGVKFRAALAYDNIAADHPLAAEFLHAEAAAVGIAAVAQIGRASCRERG